MVNKNILKIRKELDKLDDHLLLLISDLPFHSPSIIHLIKLIFTKCYWNYSYKNL